MKTRMIYASGLLSFVLGCGGSSKYEALFKETLALTNELADTMENMAGDPSERNVQKGQAKLRTVTDQLQRKAKEIGDLPKPTRDELDKEYKKETDAAEARVQRASEVQRRLQEIAKRSKIARAPSPEHAFKRASMNTKASSLLSAPSKQLTAWPPGKTRTSTSSFAEVRSPPGMRLPSPSFAVRRRS